MAIRNAIPGNVEFEMQFAIAIRAPNLFRILTPRGTTMLECCDPPHT